MFTATNNQVTTGINLRCELSSPIGSIIPPQYEQLWVYKDLQETQSEILDIRQTIFSKEWSGI